MLLMLTSARSLASTGDPPIAPPGTLDDVLVALSTYGLVPGGMYGLYTIATAIVARYRASSWLAQGKRLAMATGLLGVAGATIQAEFARGGWRVMLLAAGAMAFKLLVPTITQAQPDVAPGTPSSMDGDSTQIDASRVDAQAATIRGS